VKREATALDTFLATPAARKVHEGVLSRMLPYAATAAGRDALRGMMPLPTPEAATMRAVEIMDWKARAAAVDRDAARLLLRRIHAAREPTPRQDTASIAICESEALRERMESGGLHRWISLAGPNAAPQAGDYDLALFLYEDEEPDIAHLPNAVEVQADSPAAAIVPAIALSWLEANRGALEAAAELAALFGAATRAPELLEAHKAMAPTDRPPNVAKEAEAVAREMDAIVRASVANVVVSGAELLAALGRGVPPSVRKVLDEGIAEANRRLRQRTGALCEPFSASLPLEVDAGEVARCQAQLDADAARRRHEASAKLALQIVRLEPALIKELQSWLDFDAPFALGSFAHHYDLQPATWAARVAFPSSAHLLLADSPAVQRIAYEVGDADPVALLSGANSGGKTTLLEHIAQLVLMARLGLPVVGAGVEVPWVDEIHFVTARRSLDAGAFESFLKTFLPLAMGGSRRLILADEVEAVTEPEAAARILGFFLDRLHETGSIAVVVSHMAPMILARTHAPVRVDGIAATGLDRNNRLVVDRNPRMVTLAQSTPELIVRRLAATSRGPAKSLYEELMHAFLDVSGNAGARPPARKGKRRPPSSPATWPTGLAAT
jgi:DNA mismatch repair protein MutS2